MKTTLVWLLLGVGAWRQVISGGEAGVSGMTGGGGSGMTITLAPGCVESQVGDRPPVWTCSIPEVGKPTPVQHIRICGHEQPGDAYCVEMEPLTIAELAEPLHTPLLFIYQTEPALLATDLDTSRAGWVQP